ncbi:hypothetical protein HN51_019722 [Arachis hypogaea]|uniref:Fe2OG dioxygenase domain-containing protein n=1 Tax=Arachis hypogaea TaxID=3818 RepID=A0A445BYM0_ARAHY|nr:gibberellin 2-beta-dioxygenase 8-like isoform X1 [Arachis hypogaea]QHO31532.1 Gibberellin 2-beta-dioxygenase [Arachis hypogaea]RYR43596.1 hypothetical protein Ahy_A08g040018 [Arachis hypogaea]
MDYEPPFLETYKTLLQEEDSNRNNDLLLVENFDDEIELPLIDLNRLNENNLDERDECMEEISDAARRWGFFQIVNHGISKDLLGMMLFEQMKLFYQPFVKKSSDNFLGLPPRTYRWGNPSATNLKQLLWSEAFHFPISDISMMDNQHKSLRWNIEAFEAAVTPLAQCLAEILACKMNMIMKSKNYFKENCFQKSSIIRLNRYPPCPKLLSSKLYGLMPHNDSSFISIVYQDHVGGLELLKDGKWIHVKPNPGALVINIGDLFQALSNGIYKSIKHRVVVSQKEERYSVAFFYCPLLETLIQSHSHTKPAMYKNFTFREYREQNEKAVKQTGDKIGLSKFLL